MAEGQNPSLPPLELHHVVCPIDSGKVHEMVANHQEALTMFRRLCPAGVLVSKVAGIRRKGRYKCAWRVCYVRDVINNESLDGQEVVLRILKSHPQNTQIIGKVRTTFQPSLEVDYSLLCSCRETPNAGLFNKDLVFIEEIKTELVNLKVEGNIQE